MDNNRIIKAKGNVMSEESVEEIQLKQFYLGLQRYCRFLSRNSWDGDDLAQETIMKATKYYHQSEISSALLNKIAYHHWIDTLRKREHEVIGIPNKCLENGEKSNPDGLIDMVELLMNHLTPKQAVVFMLKEAFRYQSKEIADLLETSEMAVKSTLHRAKNRLTKKENLHSIHSYWDVKEKQLLFDLMYQSLQAEDPKILIERIPEIPSLADISRPARAIHSSSPLNSYCIAA